MRNFLLLIVSTFLLTSCLKTAEEIEREQRITELLSQHKDNQKIIADLNLQTQELQNQLSQVTGKIQDVEHNAEVSEEQEKQTTQQALAQIEAQLATIVTLSNSNQQSLASLEQKVANHQAFIQEITKTLKKKNKSKSKKSKDPLNEGITAFNKKKYKSAKNILLIQLNQGRLNAAQKNKAYHRVGLSEYYLKNYQDSISYFSKIYTKYPKSSYAPSCLYYIGMSLLKLNSKDQAKASFSELIKNYPKHYLVKSAKKQIGKL